MKRRKTLELVEVIEQALVKNPDDVVPLVKYLEMDASVLRNSKRNPRGAAEKIANRLRNKGSNDIATILRGGETVSYDEVVFDVAKNLKVKSVHKSDSVEVIEEKILQKLFADALDTMSVDEKRQLFEGMGIKGGDVPWGKGGTLLLQLIINEFGGFATYKITTIVANFFARALLGKGLAFGTNAALVQTMGVIVGPIGWITTGAWLLADLAGPAFRMTVPAVIHVALLRQIIRNRVTIGVVGDGSSGKDSLFKAVFGIDTGNIHPVAGSTKEAKIYHVGAAGSIQIINYPGFNDVDSKVNKHTEDFLHHTDVFLMVVDVNRGIGGIDLEILEKVKVFGRPTLVCLNKIDLPKPAQFDELKKTARSRLKGFELLETAFDPDQRLGEGNPIGCAEVFNWVCEKLEDEGKETSDIPKSKFAAEESSAESQSDIKREKKTKSRTKKEPVKKPTKPHSKPLKKKVKSKK